VYKQVDEEVARAVEETMKCHLWYLAEQTVPMGLFSDRVNINQKNQIAAALRAMLKFHNKTVQSGNQQCQDEDDNKSL
jgi:hypothetical protein